jgi:hypothetical protein
MSSVIAVLNVSAFAFQKYASNLPKKNGKKAIFEHFI